MTAINTWQQADRDELKAFFNGATWKTLFALWKQAISKHEVQVNIIRVSPVPLYGENASNINEVTQWVTADKVDAVYAAYVIYAETGDFSYLKEQLRGENYSSPERSTADNLIEAGDDDEAVFAILLRASLRDRPVDRSGYFNDKATPYSCLLKLSQMARFALKNKGLHPYWHPSSKGGLPYPQVDMKKNHCSAQNAEDFIQFIAREHADNLRNYRVIHICPGDNIPKNIIDLGGKMIFDRSALEESYQSNLKECLAKRQIKFDIKTATHPRWEEWLNIDKSDLEEAVWSEPVITLATQFGVSDSAIGKRCKKLGIKKPPRGFWRKVETGVYQHPKGKRATAFRSAS